MKEIVKFKVLSLSTLLCLLRGAGTSSCGTLTKRGDGRGGGEGKNPSRPMIGVSRAAPHGPCDSPRNNTYLTLVAACRAMGMGESVIWFGARPSDGRRTAVLNQ